MMILSEDQTKAINKLNKVKVGALFMEPGTGKTLAAINLIQSTDTNYCLWLTPFQTKQNLQDELKKWHMPVRTDVIGIESLSNSDRIYLELLNKVNQYSHVFVVVDESLKIKNRNAIRSQRILKIGQLAEYRLILNGTPMSRNVMDIWHQMEFLSPRILKMSYDQFKDTFVEYVRYKPANGTRWEEFIKNFHNLDYLYSLISPFVYDAKLNLDRNKSYININYPVVGNLDEYHEIKDNFLKSLFYDPDSFLKMTQTMQQAYCDEPSKFDAIKKLVDAQTIVFCKFLCSKHGLEARFNGLKVLTYGKGSLGLNLQKYNKIIFFDKTFDYAQREQAERRIYRVGQTRDCTFYTLTGDVGLESMIDNNINNKTSLSDAFKKAVAENRTEAIINEL